MDYRYGSHTVYKIEYHFLKFLTSIQPYYNISNHEYVPILVESYG